MITVQFSMTASPLTEEERPIFARMGEWVILNERNGRYRIDAVCDPEIIPRALKALQDRNPVVIGAWQFDGTPIREYPLNEREWLSVAPDDFEPSADGESTVPVRPRAFRNAHQFAGWGEKNG